MSQAPEPVAMVEQRGSEMASQDVAREVPEQRVSGHLQVRGSAAQRKFFAIWLDRDGIKRTRTLGPAHVRDSGRRTARGAIVWRAAAGPARRAR